MPEPAPLYLVAPSGHPNYGDDLIAASWLRYLAERRPQEDVWLDCPQPGRAAVMLDGIHPRLHVTDTLWRVAWQADGEDRDAAHARARELVTMRGTPREDLGLELATTARSIHLLGGGHLSANWPANLLLPTIVSEIVRRAGVSAHMTGAGLSPMDAADVGHVKEALGDFTHVEVRDGRSAETFGIDPGVDDAFLAIAVDALRIDPRPSPSGMLLLQGDLHGRDAMETALDQALAVFRDAGLEGEEIGIVESIPPEDSWQLEAVRKRWEHVRFYPFAEVWKEGLPARADQLWVTSRFHAHLVAASQGARGIAVNTGLEYYRIKHRSLLKHGTGWGLATAGDEWPAVPEATNFPAVSRRLAVGKRRVADGIYPAAGREKRRFGR